MNILFLTSPAPERAPFSTTEKRPPLGLGYLMARARLLGHQVFFVDCYLEAAAFDAEAFFSMYRVDAVALYLNTICLTGGIDLLHAVARAREDGSFKGIILVGGPHTSVGAESIPDFVDHIVIGEGEISLFEILDGQEKGRIVQGKPWQDLDTLPFLPWDLFASLPYHKSIPWVEADNVFTMNTSRGCPFSCTFCSVKSVWGKSYRYQSAGRVLAEIRHLIEVYGVEGIYFREDHFTLNKARLLEFCRGVVSSGLQFVWACETRVDALDEESITLMASSGCKAVYLGVESGSQRMLDRLGKGIQLVEVERVLMLLKKHGIVSYCSFVAGIPGETFLDLLRTKALIRRTQPGAHAFAVYVGIPGSELYREMLISGNYEHMSDNGLLFVPGYHVKTRYFYGIPSEQLVSFRFRRLTGYDLFLLLLLAGSKGGELLRRWKRRVARLAALAVGRG
uniref:Radical SAM domain protein n=1 Tax=Geobacter sp. (strain M21) TaxID=443144 RepID=C6E5U4_GEOSM